MSILFISDLHLEEDRPDITRAFQHFVENTATKAEQLYILGDFFEHWIGDDEQSDFQVEIMERLKWLSDQGIKLFFQHGNRDFLIGNTFAEMTGCTLLEEKAIVPLYGQPALLMHGDSLCTRDRGYMNFRKTARDPKWQQMFLARSLEDRQTVARQLRQISMMQNKDKEAEIMDVTPEEVVRVLEENQVHLLIHGHTHRPAVHDVALSDGSAQRIVLGDWDKAVWYLEVTLPTTSQTTPEFSLLHYPLSPA